MKFSIAYYAMLLYLTVMFRPLIPVISDAVAHTFADSSHIATVHSIYGNDHAENEMAAAGKDTGNGKDQNASKAETQQGSVHVAEKEQVGLTFLPGLKNAYTQLNYTSLPDFIISTLSPPPKPVC